MGVFSEPQSGQARFIQVIFFTTTLIFYVVGDKKSLNREGLKTISNVGFIFDLDGTLLDSASQIVPAVIETRLFFKLPILSEEEIYRLIGRPAAELFKNDPDKFFETVSYQDNSNLEWDKITNEDWYDHDLEEE